MISVTSSNPSGSTMAPEYAQPPTDHEYQRQNKNVSGSRARLMREAEKFTAICEPIA
jgi:hypothetical protein